jgi:hypothetical protein
MNKTITATITNRQGVANWPPADPARYIANSDLRKGERIAFDAPGLLIGGIPHYSVIGAGEIVTEETGKLIPGKVATKDYRRGEFVVLQDAIFYGFIEKLEV